MNRRWLPWRPRVKTDAGGPALDAVADGDLLEAAGLSLLSALTTVVALVVLIVLAVLLIAEWFLLLLLIPIVVLVRVIRLTPWVIVARRWDGMRPRATHYGEVSGWGATRALIRQVKQEIRESGGPQSLKRTRP